MKRIGYVLADFPVFSETFVGDEMRAMAALGYAVAPIVMHVSQGPAQSADLELARAAHRLSDVGAGAARAQMLRPGRSALAALDFLARQTRLPKGSLWWNAMKIAAIARAEGCDHLHAHFSGGAAAHALVAARWAGLSVSFVCHGHDVYAEAEDLPLKLAAADAVVAVCEDMATELRALTPRAKVDVVPCGTSPELFLPQSDRERFPRFLFIGRLVGQKGIDDLLEALALHPSAAVDLVGEGPMRDELMARAERLGLGARANFLGARPREWVMAQAPHYLALVAPFKPAPDGSRDAGPMVVKEAMAMELPVVGARFMGLKEMVAPDTGFLAEPGDPAGLADALDHMLRLSPAARAEMGRRGRQTMIEQFSLDVASRKLAAIFEAA